MRITLFTVERATRLAHELAPQLEHLVGLRRELRRLEERLGVVSLALAGATEGNPDAEELRALASRRGELTARIRAGLEAIDDRGAVVKDLDLGLIDFYSLAGDRLVFLCWKLGEAEVGHWHPLDGGYASRRSLDTSPLEE
jgi:hypothetical protein